MPISGDPSVGRTFDDAVLGTVPRPGHVAMSTGGGSCVLRGGTALLVDHRARRTGGIP
ncbi:MAG TPA: hypothetical protein VIU87_27090 [Mycobacterium sp.]